MNIGYSFLFYEANYAGGVNTYMLGLLEGLLNTSGPHKIQLYIRKKDLFVTKRFSAFKNLEIIPINRNRGFFKLLRLLSIGFQNKRFYTLANSSRELRELIVKNSDIFYIPTTFLFPTKLKIPSIVSIHDIQQFHFPNFLSFKERLRRKIIYDVTVEQASFIQASSRFIQSDLIEHYPNHITKNKVPVIPEGVNTSIFKKSQSDKNILKKYNLPEKFLFYPAQLWPHKNHLRVLTALKLIKDEAGVLIPIVLTGAKYGATQNIFNYIKENSLASQVYYLGKVPFLDLVELYKLSTYVITATLYESNSLPMLEGAAAGRPLIASKTPPNLELSNNLKMTLFDPFDPNDIAKQFLWCWKNIEKGNDEARSNLEVIEKYSWNNIARQYILTFESIMRNSTVRKGSLEKSIPG